MVINSLPKSIAKEEAERLVKEQQIKAKKAISQYVGEIGTKIEIEGTYVFSGSWEQKAFTGFGTVTMYAHTFKDVNGNVFIWKTQNSVPFHKGEPVRIKATVKDHTEYQDEKQTVLTRCRCSLIDNE